MKEGFIMPILDCSVRNCFYNKENKCCLDGIKVEGTAAEISSATACGSFKEKMGDRLTNNCSCSDEPTTHSSVDCLAENCVFNERYVCHADHIGIEGSNACKCEDTECASFRKR